jgi:3',5'-cyclic AMP phosphodiesterase CpdA
VRIAHATDIHWFVPPGWLDFAPRRVVGTMNLYAFGRRHEFDERVQDALVAHLVEEKPDLVLITGDLTAQALPAEFVKARKALDPLLIEVPTFVIPGNHDTYTPGAVRRQRFHENFGPWNGKKDPSGLVRFDLEVGDQDRVTAFGLDPNRPTLMTASGWIPDAQLAALERALAEPDLVGRTVILATHYPPVDRRGDVYDGAAHGLRNARALIGVLDRSPVRPCLVACGHIHPGFRADIVLSDGARVPVVNCGTSGQSFQPERRRAAATAAYRVEGNTIVGVERWLHDGQRFVPEADGPFTSGR